MAKVNVELIDNHHARLTVALDPAQVESELKGAARRIAAKVNIPGFRKGKAPYHIIRQYFGEPAIYEEALDSLGQSAYVEALEEANIAPYAAGSLEDFSFEDPMTLTFTVPMQPEVDLGNYREVRHPFEPDTVTEEDVDHAILHMREEEAILEPVERGIEMGDVARLQIRGEIEDSASPNDEPASEQEQLFIDRKGVRVKVDHDSTYPVPGFPEQVVGMVVGDQREFSIQVPDDPDDLDESIRGKSIHFDVTCEEVYRYELPELDDEFAQGAGNFQTVDDLRSDIRSQLEAAANQRATNQYASAVISKLLDDGIVTLAYPSEMLDEQIDDMVSDFENDLKKQGVTLEAYLEMSSVTEDDLRKDFSEVAEQRLKRALILGKLVETEGLTISDEEVDDEIKTRVLSFGEQAGLAERLFDTPRMRNLIANELISDRAVGRLAAIARGENPPLKTPDPEQELSTPETAAPEE